MKVPGGISKLLKKKRYVVFWIVATIFFGAYLTLIIMEQTAPLNPITGFHESVAGSYLFMADAPIALLSGMTVSAGLTMWLIGLLAHPEWKVPGTNILAFGGVLTFLHAIASL